LKVWDVDTGREVRTLAGHSDRVNGAALSSDGRHAVSVSQDRTLRVWNVDAGEVLATFTCDAGANCASLSSLHAIIAGDDLGRIHFLSLIL
jgi:WD40 repeat protein